MKLSYISDQRYYLAEDGYWYTTASFPLDEITAALPKITNWVFYGRLGRTTTTDHLFRLPQCACKIEYRGLWGVSSGAYGQLSSLWKQRALLRRLIRESDVIWFKLPFFATAIGWLCGNFQGKLTIAQMVGNTKALTEVYGKKWAFVSAMLGWCAKRMYRNVSLPVFVSRQLAKEYGENRSDTLICNESRVTEALIQRDSSTERTKIIFIGRLSPEKGVQLLLHSFSQLYEKYPHVKLQLIGDGALRSELEMLAQELKIVERVIFSGYIAWEDVFGLLADAVVLVLPSYTEGLPLVLVEAMSQGVPVIASRVGGIPELVENGINGLLFDPGDKQGLIQALDQLLKDCKACEAMGSAGMDTARANTFSKQTGRILEWIRQKQAEGQ